MPAPRTVNLIGCVVGRLTVVSESQKTDGKGRRVRAWRCECECGQSTIVTTGNLKSGHTNSCGCIKREILDQQKALHAQFPKREIRIWDNMIQRCTNPRNDRFPDYGGRGITVSQPWRTFTNFLSDMGPCPDGHSIDRIDNNGPYTGPCMEYPQGNCRWATNTQQTRNKRENVVISYNGRSMCLAEWAEVLRINYNTLYNRLRNGWTVERAFTQRQRGNNPSHARAPRAKSQKAAASLGAH